NDQSIDVRVSTIPAKYGEKIVMRLLNRSKEHLELGNLGLTDRERTAYESAIKQPNGIVLITGPTGSGKTTTLYASLNQLNTPDKNLTTIEDPIEYNLTGINQVQVRSDIGLTFDRALRAFLRQDPNIIMVGEIRDEETAQIAIRAALTGHLVLSTLHTNSSRDAITRLVDMGVEPYLLAAATRMIVAQRLVRLLCPHCKKKSDRMISESFQKRHQLHDHYEPVGCPSCFYTGYKGRKAVYELLPITDDIRLAMRKIGDGQISFPSTDLPSLGENLITLTQTGQISIEEALYHYQ
ncbi:MAG: GspE/PulE family protein, partial [Bacteroidota bacterium]